jgi:hypothetical protein
MPIPRRLAIKTPQRSLCVHSLCGKLPSDAECSGNHESTPLGVPGKLRIGRDESARKVCTAGQARYTTRKARPDRGKAMSNEEGTGHVSGSVPRFDLPPPLKASCRIYSESKPAWFRREHRTSA